MALKIDMPEITKAKDIGFNPYSFCSEELQPGIFPRSIKGHPMGGESIALCWNLEQAKGFFINCPYDYLTVLCLDTDTMKMAYCKDMESAVIFYRKENV